MSRASLVAWEENLEGELHEAQEEADAIRPPHKDVLGSKDAVNGPAACEDHERSTGSAPAMVCRA